MRFQAPSAVEQIVFVFISLVERVEPLTHDDVASGARAAHVARVLDVDVVFQQHFANGAACSSLQFNALRAEFGMGQDFDDRHLDVLDVLSSQGMLNASVHALCGKGFGAFGQCFGGGFDGNRVFEFFSFQRGDHQRINACTVFG
jgi:hypothetical protein